MRTRTLTLRALLSAFLAVVFLVAAEPGVMAMPAPQPLQPMMTMTCADQAMPGCEHMKLPKDKEAPCKNMALCAGMMSCFGMAAVATALPMLRTTVIGASVHGAPQTLLGLTLQPDNPPPRV